MITIHGANGVNVTVLRDDDTDEERENEHANNVSTSVKMKVEYLMVDVHVSRRNHREISSTRYLSQTARNILINFHMIRQRCPTMSI